MSLIQTAFHLVLSVFFPPYILCIMLHLNGNIENFKIKDISLLESVNLLLVENRFWTTLYSTFYTAVLSRTYLSCLITGVSCWSLSKTIIKTRYFHASHSSTLPIILSKKEFVFSAFFKKIHVKWLLLPSCVNKLIYYFIIYSIILWGTEVRLNSI